MNAGYAELLKILIKQAQYDWLDKEDNAEKWYGNEGQFSAKDRRIFIPLWAGNAYEKLISEEYDSFRWRLFEKTVCLITANGLKDKKITQEGLPNYKVTAPVTYMEPSTTVPVSNHVEPSPVEVEEILDSDDEADEEQVEELV